MQSELARSGVLVLSLALAVLLASSPAWAQTDTFMSPGRSSVDAGSLNPGNSSGEPDRARNMDTLQPSGNILPGGDLSPVLDASLVEALRRQQASQERDILEGAAQRDAVREEQRRQGPARRGFFSDFQ